MATPSRYMQQAANAPIIGSAHYVGVALTPALVRYLTELAKAHANPHDPVSMEAYVKFMRVLEEMQKSEAAQIVEIAR